MKINSVAGRLSFGLKLPENFSQMLAGQCAGLSDKNAIKLEEALKKLPSEIISIKNLYTTSRKMSMFGPRFNYLGFEYEQTMPTGEKIIKNYGYAYSGKKPFNAKDIFKKVAEFISSVSEKNQK